MNNTIIKEFEKLIAFIQNDIDMNKEVVKNKFRLKQLSRVYSLLKKFPKKITLFNYTELNDVDGIGKSSVERIHEILENGYIELTKNFIDTKQEKRDILEELEEIVGVGRINALDLYKMGVTSINVLKEKIKNKEIVVNNKILLGLKYYGKYHMNIPRSEMELYSIFFTRFIDSINKKINKKGDKNNYMVEICGSYRREKQVSNDIDVLITKMGSNNKDMKVNHLERFIRILKEPMKRNDMNPLLVDSMTDNKIKTKYMGFSKLHNNLIRRIDIRFIPYNSYYSALLYFTGSGELNKKMRSIAKTKGYKLSEYGLYKEGEMIKVTSERDIFKKLDMEYLPPRLR